MSRQVGGDTGKPPPGGKGHWTREAAGYCSFLLLKNPDEAEKHDAQLVAAGDDRRRVERKTKRKLAATKEYINQNRRELWVYLYHRELRREAMEASIAIQGMTAEAAQSVRAAHFEKESQFLRVRRARTSLKEFTILARLGKGGYGQVYLARKVDTGEILALKQMKKSRFMDRNEVGRVKKEREVMTKINSIWLARLKYCFQSQHYLYMAMEYIPGGDLKTLLDHMTALDEEDAKFLFAEMVLAVDALHQLGYIHRDLKPDNFMIDRNGHLKLIDFGLSKEGFNEKLSASRTSSKRRQSLHRVNTWSKRDTPLVPQSAKTRNRQRKVYSVVGSPEYMAVEILNQDFYTNLVDYWSLGVILYEFIFGMTPFGADTVGGVFDNVKNFETRVIKPPREEDDECEDVSEDCWNLITSLITSADKRIGKNGLADMKAHAWFKGFDWDAVRDMEPPFIPNLESENDTSYFPEDAPFEKSDLVALEADLDHMISKTIARSTEGKSMETVFDHRSGKSKEHPDISDSASSHDKASKRDSSKKRGSSRRHEAPPPGVPPLLGLTQSPTKLEAATEHPKLKFNQSYSKFDFAGFTFKHEDLSILDAALEEQANQQPAARSRSNSTVELDASASNAVAPTTPSAVEEVPLTIIMREPRSPESSRDSPGMPALMAAGSEDSIHSHPKGSGSTDSSDHHKPRIGPRTVSSDRIDQQSAVHSAPSLAPSAVPDLARGDSPLLSHSAGPSSRSGSGVARRADEPDPANHPKLGRNNTVVINNSRPSTPLLLNPNETRAIEGGPVSPTGSRRNLSRGEINDLDSLKRRLSKLKGKNGSPEDSEEANSSNFSDGSSTGSRGSTLEAELGAGEEKKKKKGGTLRKGWQAALEMIGLGSPRQDSSSHIVVSTKSNTSSKVTSPRERPSIELPGSAQSPGPTRARSGTAGNAEQAGIPADLADSAKSSSSSHSRQSRHMSEGRGSEPRTRLNDDHHHHHHHKKDSHSREASSHHHHDRESSSHHHHDRSRSHTRDRSSSRPKSRDADDNKSKESTSSVSSREHSKERESSKERGSSSKDRESKDRENKDVAKDRTSHRSSSRPGSRNSSRPSSRRGSQQRIMDDGSEPKEHMDAKERILALARAHQESQLRLQQQPSSSGTHSSPSSGKSTPRPGSPSRRDDASAGSNEAASSPPPNDFPSPLQAVRSSQSSEKRKRSSSSGSGKSRRMSHRLSSTDVKSALQAEPSSPEAAEPSPRAKKHGHKRISHRLSSTEVNEALLEGPSSPESVGSPPLKTPSHKRLSKRLSTTELQDLAPTEASPRLPSDKPPPKHSKSLKSLIEKPSPSGSHDFTEDEPVSPSSAHAHTSTPPSSSSKKARSHTREKSKPKDRADSLKDVRKEK